MSLTQTAKLSRLHPPRCGAERSGAERKVSRSRNYILRRFSWSFIIMAAYRYRQTDARDKSEIRKTHTLEDTRLACNSPLRMTRTCPLQSCFIVSAFTVVKVNFAPKLTVCLRANACCKTWWIVFIYKHTRRYTSASTFSTIGNNIQKLQFSINLTSRARVR